MSHQSSLSKFFCKRFALTLTIIILVETPQVVAAWLTLVDRFYPNQPIPETVQTQPKTDDNS